MLPGAVLLALALAAPGPATAQPAGAAQDEARDQAFVEGLRRQDPEAAVRYESLRDARRQAIADLRHVREQYAVAGPALRPAYIGKVRKAERAYAEASLALLDFLDDLDRRTLAGYQERIKRIEGLLEERRKDRAQVERLLAE
jgi:hypothetical protein